MPGTIPNTNITGKGYIKREEFKVFADVSAGDAAAPEWELQGDKVEDMSLELNPNVETITDVTGVTTTVLDKYEVQTSVGTYRAKRDSKFGAILYDIVKEKKILSDVERAFLCVNLFSGTDGKYDAWTQKAVVAVQSYGGDTKGLNIPYNIHWEGERTHGTAAIADGKVTFTPGAPAEPAQEGI